MNRAQTICNIKFKIQITSQILNHFQKQDYHEAQHEETSLKHVIIWWNKEVENLPIWKGSCNTVVVWPSWSETNAPPAPQSWMMKLAWLEIAWNGFNLELPLMELSKNSPWILAYSWKIVFATAPKTMEYDGTIDQGLCSLKVFSKNAKWRKMSVFEKMRFSVGESGC